MRRFAATSIAVLALLAPAAAFAADVPVKINATTGFDPAGPLLEPGDQIVYSNETPGFASVQFEGEADVLCETGFELDCVRPFPTAGQFKFYDPQHSGCTSYATCVDPFRGIVIVDGPPSASGLTGPATALRGQAVTFTGAGTDPNGDAITSFNWNFGDGGTAQTTTGTAQHPYAAAGRYTVSLTVTDARGNTSAARTIAIDITVPDTDADGFDDDHDTCALIPGVAPDGCPPIPPPPPIIVPPEISLNTVTAQTLGVAGALRSGVNVVIGCSDTCVAELDIVPLGSARKAALPGAYASRTITITGAGSEVVTLRFTAPAKRLLSRLPNPRVTLVVVVTDSLGRVQKRVTTIALKTRKTKTRLPAIGISDQQSVTFTDPLFQVLDLRYARLVSPWNAIFTEPERLDAWLQAARAQGVRPLVAFNHRRSDLCPRKPCKAPTKGQFSKAWKAFHRKYPWVKDISPWNEVNSATQPTGKRPDLAATYYNVVRASCRGCTIVAADVLDTNNMRRYLATFLKKAKGKPRLWGLHNYRDTNRFRKTGTTQLLKAVKGQIWFTETGGIVEFTTQDGKKALRKSEKRAKKAMDYVFKLSALSPRRIKRVYVYQWKINFAGDRFDAGVVRPDGTPRPSFDVLTLNASIARKR